ncbi:MAG: hypothetical protein P4L53_20965 [Candidatus Obscuribacterales bacterium]|nr:hypothetical protein [Candidatus Obscuribacterales bacterium]
MKVLALAEAFGPDSREVQISVLRLACYFMERQDADANCVDDALPYYQRIVEIAHRLNSKKPPERPDYEAVLLMHDLEMQYLKHARATTEYRESCTASRRVLVDIETLDHDKRAEAERDVAWALAGEGKYSAAVAVYEDVVLNLQARWGPNHYQLVQDLEKLAKYQDLAHLYGKEEVTLVRAVNICKKSQAGYLVLLQLMEKLANCQETEHKYCDAVDTMSEAIAVCKQGEGRKIKSDCLFALAIKLQKAEEECKMQKKH